MFRWLVSLEDFPFADALIVDNILINSTTYESTPRLGAGDPVSVRPAH